MLGGLTRKRDDHRSLVTEDGLNISFVSVKEPVPVGLASERLAEISEKIYCRITAQQCL